MSGELSVEMILEAALAVQRVSKAVMEALAALKCVEEAFEEASPSSPSEKETVE